MAAKKTKPGKLSIADMRKMINKRAGQDVAYNLTEDNPTEVKQWIPTGARWLDSIICRGVNFSIMSKYSHSARTSLS